MPRLLPHGVLEAPSFTTRWTAIVAAACALTAWQLDWTGAYDAIRDLIPATGEVYTWDEHDLADAPTGETTGLLEGIDDPAAAQARTLTVPDGNITLDLVWEAPLTIGELRLETYTDAFGTGHRLGIAAEATTAGGPNCLNARLIDHEAVTVVQWCSRADQHPPRDNAALLGKEADDDWAPDRLFITQTANLDPAAYGEATQIDYFGFGVDTGSPHESRLWPTGLSFQTGAQTRCTDLRMRLRLEDLHLTDRYNDPASHQTFSDEPFYTTTPSFPEENRLLTQACVPIGFASLLNTMVTKPFQTDTATTLAGWSRYNAATRAPQPMRTALVIDIRSCDADMAACTSDPEPEEYPINDGVGKTWMTELLGS